LIFVYAICILTFQASYLFASKELLYISSLIEQFIFK
jgi:hypothetical protein